ncbi:MAG: terminase [Dyella sp.]|uniref:terminase n=1 Tax=Dyella sp. TaxID=1869338 RepID=UPI003F82398C
MARPTAYKPEYVAQAKKLAAMGLTDAEIADFFGVAVRTLYNWKVDYKAFAKALKQGKKAPDERVQASLYKRACGYEFKTEKVFQHQGKVVRAKTVEHVPPDVTAGIFWMKNRDPENWRDRQEHEHGGKVIVKLDSTDAQA